MDQRVVKKFADDTEISEALAAKLLNKLYEKGLDAEWFSAALYRLECMIKEGKLADLINSATDEEIQRVVDLLAVQADYENGAWASEIDGETHVRFFNDMSGMFAEGKKFEDGQEVEIQVMRVGNWKHPRYGEIKIDAKALSEFKANFDNRSRGIDLCVDENHEENHRALAWYKELRIEGDALFATLALTAKGAELLNEGAYKYFSPEIIFKKVDEESNKVIENQLIGGAFTNRPFFKGMKPLKASEDATRDSLAKDANSDLFFTDSPPMKKFYELVAKLTGQKAVSASEVADLEKAFGEIEAPTDTEKTILSNLKASFSEGGEDGKAVKANEVVVDATKFAALEIAATQGSEALKKLEAMELSEKVTSLTLSETNRAGRFHANQSEALTAFLKDLTAEKREQFAELVKAMPNVKFGEVGSAAGGEASKDVVQTVSDGVSKKMSEAKEAGKAITAKQATQEYFAANPGMLQKYNEAMGYGVEDDE